MKTLILSFLLIVSIPAFAQERIALELIIDDSGVLGIAGALDIPCPRDTRGDLGAALGRRPAHRTRLSGELYRRGARRS